MGRPRGGRGREEPGRARPLRQVLHARGPPGGRPPRPSPSWRAGSDPATPWTTSCSPSSGVGSPEAAPAGGHARRREGGPPRQRRERGQRQRRPARAEPRWATMRQAAQCQSARGSVLPPKSPANRPDEIRRAHHLATASAPHDASTVEELRPTEAFEPQLAPDGHRTLRARRLAGPARVAGGGGEGQSGLPRGLGVPQGPDRAPAGAHATERAASPVDERRAEGERLSRQRPPAGTPEGREPGCRRAWEGTEKGAFRCLRSPVRGLAEPAVGGTSSASAGAATRALGGAGPRSAARAPWRSEVTSRDRTGTRGPVGHGAEPYRAGPAGPRPASACVPRDGSEDGQENPRTAPPTVRAGDPSPARADAFESRRRARDLGCLPVHPLDSLPVLNHQLAHRLHQLAAQLHHRRIGAPV